MFAKFLILLSTTALLTSCSLYTSEGRKSFEKADLNTNSLVLLNCHHISDEDLAQLLLESEGPIWTEISAQEIIRYQLAETFVEECVFQKSLNAVRTHD